MYIFLEINLSFLKNLLNLASPGSTSTIVSTELYEILCLANEFLPPLSQGNLIFFF